MTLMEPILTHESEFYRLSWYRLGESFYGKHDPNDPRSRELLSLGAERREDDAWASFLPESPMLTMMPAETPDVCLRGALEYFTEVLETIPPERAVDALSALAWSDLTDTDIVRATLRHVEDDSIVSFFQMLLKHNPDSTPRAFKLLRDDQLATLTEEQCISFVQNASNALEKAAALRMLRENAHRIPALQDTPTQRQGRTR